MKQVKHKLTLNKKTVADLSNREMDDLRGGTLSLGPLCYSVVPEYCGPTFYVGCESAKYVECYPEQPPDDTEPLYCVVY